MRSRGSSLPRARCFARAPSPPPSLMPSTSFLRSSTWACMAAWLRWKFSERVSISLLRMDMRDSRRLVEDFAADQHAPDLAGAGTDLVELGIAQQAAGRIVIDVAVATEALDRFQRHPGRLLRAIEDDARRVLARDLALVARLRHRIAIGATGRQRRIHVRHLALHQLEGADRLPELLAVVDVGDDDVHRRLHDAKGTRCQYRAL